MNTRRLTETLPARPEVVSLSGVADVEITGAIRTSGEGPDLRARRAIVVPQVGFYRRGIGNKAGYFFYQDQHPVNTGNRTGLAFRAGLSVIDPRTPSTLTDLRFGLGDGNSMEEIPVTSGGVDLVELYQMLALLPTSITQPSFPEIDIAREMARGRKPGLFGGFSLSGQHGDGYRGYWENRKYISWRELYESQLAAIGGSNGLREILRTPLSQELIEADVAKLRAVPMLVDEKSLKKAARAELLTNTDFLRRASA